MMPKLNSIKKRKPTKVPNIEKQQKKPNYDAKY
jgi:hypothetical protein